MSAADCPSCGCNLVASTIRDESFGHDDVDGGLEFVEMCRSRGGYPLAMLVKQTLEQNGVAVILQGGNFLSVMPNLAFGGELRVLVPRHQLEYARELYEAYFEGSGENDFATGDETKYEG